jgi:hypothetical protein
MRIVSDFRDYYDVWANGTGPTLTRLAANAGPDKPEQFRLLAAAGFLTPPHGPAGEVMGSWWESEQRRVKAVVAYLDPVAHRGEGKAVWGKGGPELRTESKMGYHEGNERARRNAEVFASAYLGGWPCDSTRQSSTSLRRLQIGRRVLWLEYHSTESWMSNVGEGTCELVGDDGLAGYHPRLPYPLFAIDFVLGREMYAVDLNVAPGIRGSGAEQVLPGDEACDELERALFHFRSET